MHHCIETTKKGGATHDSLFDLITVVCVIAKLVVTTELVSEIGHMHYRF